MNSLTELPVNSGLNYAFDCNNYVDGATEWVNSNGGTSAIVVGGQKYLDGSVLLPETTGYAYWINDDSYTESTKYIVFKVNFTSYAGTYYDVFTERGSSIQKSIDIDVIGGSAGYIGLYANGDKTATTISGKEYHCVALSNSNGVCLMYIDGKKVAEDSVYQFVATNYGLNCSSITGNTPTKGVRTLYIKCALVCKTAHAHGEILQNSIWLMEQYGLKLPEKNSRLAGTDAVAIAYAIARNQESASSLQQLKKAYRDGTLNGDDENTSEEYTEDGSQPIGIDQDPTNPNPDKKPTSPGITDMSENGGVFYTAETDGETPEQYYIKIYTDGETGSDTAGEGTGRVSYVYTYHLCYAIYYADGTLKTSGTFGGNGGISRNYWYYKVRVNGVYTAYYWISGVSINGNKYTVTISGLVVSTGKQTTEQITGTFTSLPDNVSITTTTNVNPF